LENTAFLRSNLGFTEWLHSAFGPTRCFNDPVGIEEDCKNKEQFRFLRPGHHPPVGSAAQTTKSVPPAVKGVKVQFNEEQLAAETAKDRFDRESKDYKSAIKPLYDALPIIKYNYKQVINPTYAKREADQKLCPQVKFPANLNKDYFVELQTVQDAYRLAGENAKNANKLAEARDYNHASGEIKKATEEAESVYADINEAKDKGDQFSKYFKQCEALSAPKKKEVPLDPPIDNISQTVQFLVAMNVSATPNWNLVRFKSNAAPAFAELVHNNTQTLTAVIGPPGASKAGANQELINFQTLTNYLRPVPPAIP
jgi:hypothetical protein